VVEINEGIGRPKSPFELVPRNELPGVLGQYPEQLDRLTLQTQFQTAFAQFAGTQI
jgi:hypothetical protein